MAGLFRRMLGILGLMQVRNVSPVWFGTDDRTVARVYSQVEQEFGVLAPPIALHAPAPEVMAGVWLMLRETVVAHGLVARPVKEVVAAAVSLGNACPYCVSVHTGALSSLVPGRDGAVIARGDVELVADPALRAVAQWAHTSADRQAAQRPGPFPASHAPEMVGVAVVLHYLNRMVNVFLRDAPMPPGVPTFALGTIKRVLGGVMRRPTDTSKEPGASLDLLPAAPPPADLGWTAGNPSVAAAFARGHAAVAAAGERSVPAGVRELVTAELAGWDGRARGISRAWVDAAVAGLSEADRPAGRLAMLMAFASYQVDRQIINELRASQPDDRQLIELASWASLAAALRIGSWQRVDAADQADAADNEWPAPQGAS